MILQGGRIRIEISFTGEVSDDVRDLVFVDVSEWFEDGLEIARGRNRSVDLFTAARARFRLDNRDRTFDPTNSDGPFFGNIRPMLPVRIFVELDDDYPVLEPLFDGYVTDWTLRYERPNDAWVDVECRDAFIVFASDDLPDEAPVGDGDDAAARIGRTRQKIGWDGFEDLQAGLFPLAATTFGTNALIEMDVAATSDASLLFMSRDGVLKLRSATDVFGGDSKVTFVQANVTGSAGTTFHDVEVETASELLYNRAIIAWDGGTVVKDDAASVARFLPRTLRVRTVLREQSDAELLADFVLARFAQPELRLRSVTVKLHDRRLTVEQRRQIAALDLGDVVTVVRRPPGSGSPAEVEFRQIVEGMSWRYSRDRWTVTLALGEISVRPFKLDDAELGELDTGGVLTF